MKKKIKRGRTEGKKTHYERKGYLGREKKGRKRKDVFVFDG